MNSKLVAIALVTVGGLLTACSEGPARADLRSELESRLHPAQELVSFKIEARDNVGNKADPVIKTRVTAVARWQEPLYASAGWYDNVIAAVQSYEKGGERAISGIITSRLSPTSEWQHNLSELQGLNVSGFTMDQVIEWASNQPDYTPSTVLLAGTEGTAFVDEWRAKYERSKWKDTSHSTPDYFDISFTGSGSISVRGRESERGGWSTPVTGTFDRRTRHLNFAHPLDRAMGRLSLTVSDDGQALVGTYTRTVPFSGRYETEITLIPFE